MPIADAGDLTTLQTAIATTGAGVLLPFAGYKRLTVEVSGTFSATVTFEGTVDDSSFFAVGLVTASNGAAVTTATTPSAYKLPIDGPALSAFRARVSAFSSGNVTVKARREWR